MCPTLKLYMYIYSRTKIVRCIYKYRATSDAIYCIKIFGDDWFENMYTLHIDCIDCKLIDNETCIVVFVVV